MRPYMQEQMEAIFGNPDDVDSASAQSSANLGFAGRGLHSSTFRLNLSALYGIWDAHRGCVARVEGVLGGV